MRNFLISMLGAVALAGIFLGVYYGVPRGDGRPPATTADDQPPPTRPRPTSPKKPRTPPTAAKPTPPEPEPEVTLEAALDYTAKDVLPEYREGEKKELADKERLFGLLTLTERPNANFYLDRQFSLMPPTVRTTLYNAGFVNTIRARATEVALEDERFRKAAAAVWGRLPADRRTRAYGADLTYRWGLLSPRDALLVQSYFTGRPRTFLGDEEREAVRFWVGDDRVFTGGR